MSTKTKFILITLLFGIPALILGRQIWPPSPMMPVPTPTQFPFFAFLAITEATAFGSGIAFLILGWPLVSKIGGQNKFFSRLVFFSIAWYLINWWPHDNLHVHNGEDLQGLLYIEYSFHLTMIIAGGILAYAFFTRILKSK